MNPIVTSLPLPEPLSPSLHATALSASAALTATAPVILILLRRKVPNLSIRIREGIGYE
ncbi:hypothetical protein ACIBI3_27970 [Actinomadura luteofluorescens]|uniref:hypothetical protein n=1 Tax=Actinomadura luteofluorescens TaxID=46163 RepID=UPI00348E41FD